MGLRFWGWGWGKEGRSKLGIKVVLLMIIYVDLVIDRCRVIRINEGKRKKMRIRRIYKKRREKVAFAFSQVHPLTRTWKLQSFLQRGSTFPKILPLLLLQNKAPIS